MKKSIIWQLAIVAILFSTPSYAEPSALTLDQVIKESLQKNTSLFRAQRDFEDRMADVTETTLLDNPELQIARRASPYAKRRTLDADIAFATVRPAFPRLTKVRSIHPAAAVPREDG